MSRLNTLSSLLLNEKRWYILFLLPALTFITVITLYPLLYSLYLSFRIYNPLRPWRPSRFVGLDNYLDLFTDPVWLNSMVVTLIFTSVAVSIEFVFGLGIALLFSYQLKGINLFRGLIIVPMVLAPVVVGLMWKYQLSEGFGVIRYLVGLTGIELKWHGDPATALPTIILIDVWQWTPFIAIILLSGIMSLPQDVYDAVKIDGAGAWRRFFWVTLPLLKPIVLIAVLLRLVDTFKTFDKVWILTRGGPSRATELYSLLVFKQGFRYFNIGQGTSLALVILVVILIITIVFIKVSGFSVEE